MRMNPRLHKLLLELDFKYDITIGDYFSLSESEKNDMAQLFASYYSDIYKNDRQELIHLINFLIEKREEMTREESYEMSDLYSRFINKLDYYLHYGRFK
jgi:hypothetical protein